MRRPRYPYSSSGRTASSVGGVQIPLTTEWLVAMAGRWDGRGVAPACLNRPWGPPGVTSSAAVPVLSEAREP